jgi:ribokinase
VTIRPRIFGLGQCCIDSLGLIESFPAPDSKCELSDLVVQGGGPVATALVALSRWGMRCACAGVIGDDPHGAAIRQSLDDENIDTGGLRVRPGQQSQLSFIVAEPGAGRRTVFWRRPTGAPLAPEELDLDLLRRADLLYTDGIFPRAALAAAQAANDARIPIVVDAGSLREGMLELARLSDHFIVGEPFARAFAPDAEPLQVCHRIAGLGPRVAGLTLGSRGCVAVADGRELVQPAYPVDPVDTTGCGDVFHAGYAYALIHGFDVRDRLDFASWAASRIALELGGRTAIPRPDEWPGAVGQGGR